MTAPRDMKVLNTPASISVITAKELEEQGITNIGDAIVRIPEIPSIRELSWKWTVGYAGGSVTGCQGYINVKTTMDNRYSGRLFCFWD